MLEIDVRRPQLARQRLRDRLFRYERTIDDNTPELATAAFLFVESKLELFVGQQTLLNQEIAQANLFRTSHCKLQ